MQRILKAVTLPADTSSSFTESSIDGSDLRAQEAEQEPRAGDGKTSRVASRTRGESQGEVAESADGKAMNRTPVENAVWIKDRMEKKKEMEMMFLRNCARLRRRGAARAASAWTRRSS